MTDLPYKRILLKLSGERLGGDGDEILSVNDIAHLAEEIKSIHDAGAEVGVVLGAGNIIRGSEAAQAGFEEAQAHYMGMLGTVINALAMQSALEQKGVYTRVMSAIEMQSVAEPYIRRRAIRHMEKKRVVIFAGGTGNPFFTTDTAGALRAVEIGADLLVKATKVDGIYTADPKKDSNAKHLSEITYQDILVDDLKVMDGAAIALCKEHRLPLMVCDSSEKGGFKKAIKGEVKRTLVTG